MPLTRFTRSMQQLQVTMQLSVEVKHDTHATGINKQNGKVNKKKLKKERNRRWQNAECLNEDTIGLATEWLRISSIPSQYYVGEIDSLGDELTG